MSKAYVLLTAMPPTIGHLHLIQYANNLASEVTVILNTQPDEPYPYARVAAVKAATQRMPRVRVVNIHKPLPQEPEGNPGFWDMWVGFLRDYGFRAGDYIVASEMYGKKLAEVAGGIFMPYDLNRWIIDTKATRVRERPRDYFQDILPEFQQNLLQVVTVFGAESVGKTTLTQDLAMQNNGHAIFEWARPYLEAVGEELTTQKMTNIWKGQGALQSSALDLLDRPFIFQDTDLFSTVGYWKLHEHEFGPVPKELIWDAQDKASDLYIIPRSNIPFEPDPLRYGGDVREADDSWWLQLADAYGLRYRVLEESDRIARNLEASRVLDEFYEKHVHIAYNRVGS